MSSSRRTEKWLNRGLWLISVIFASFLIGLGGLVVHDLPKTQHTNELKDFVEPLRHESLLNQVKARDYEIRQVEKELSDANVIIQQQERAYANSKEVFNNWLSTRYTTKDIAQNEEVLAKTRELEQQQSSIRKQSEKIDALQEKQTELYQLRTKEQEQLNDFQSEGYKLMHKAERSQEIQVFLLRLALTLPLLLIGAWLFARKRHSTYWPFVWGFIFFALFAFFVELVPYLPSYGGYIRYLVGIVVTFFIGHYSIKALQKYLENQKKAESMPSTELKEKLNYDLAHQRLARSICPGCERPIDLKDPARNFCVHCGTCVYNNCVQCQTRKNAFAKHCHSCGATA